MIQRILVTGGLGYIGSHTVVELITKGYEVTIIDDLSNSRLEVLDNLFKITGVKPKFYQFSLMENKRLKDFFKTNSFDFVIHFAAHIFVDESVEKPLKYYNNNIVSLLNLLTEMKNTGIKNILFSSSCTVYGEPDVLPISEKDAIKESNSPYGTTKIMAERILEDICTLEKSITGISLRYFNPVGAHDSALIGEFPKGKPRHLFPIISKVLKGEAPELKVYGNDYDTKDGTAVRDYIHVVDLAIAHVKALNRFKNKDINPYESYNVGTGNGYSILEVIHSFEKVTGKKIKYSFSERRKGDIAKIWANSSLVEKTLNWKAKRGIDNMVETAEKWEHTFK